MRKKGILLTIFNVLTLRCDSINQVVSQALSNLFHLLVWKMLSWCFTSDHRRKESFLMTLFLLMSPSCFGFTNKKSTVLFKEVVLEVKCLRLFECHGRHVHLSDPTFDSSCKCPFVCFPSDTEEPYDARLRS